MLFPSVFRSHLEKSRKSLENEMILIGHPYYRRKMDIALVGVLEKRSSACGHEWAFGWGKRARGPGTIYMYYTCDVVAGPKKKISCIFYSNSVFPFWTSRWQHYS